MHTMSASTSVSGLWVVCLIVMGVFASSVSGGVLGKTLSNGDQIQYDGTYYDFRAANGRSMVKLWVPPSGTVRGVFISGHGGGSGDSRDFARQENMKALAARFHFGLAGLHCFPGRRVFETGGPTFFGALDEFAALGEHPELANIPFVIFGSSNGGATSYGFVNSAPERAICFVTNVSSWFNPPVPVEGALKVPGVMIVGKFDPFGRGQQGVDRLLEVLAAARAKGARWSAIVENKGHEDGIAFDVYVKLVEQCIALRYAADADPSRGPVKLVDIPEDTGYLADPSTWDSGLTAIAEYVDYAGDRGEAHWLPNRDMAYVYRAAATRNNPISVGVQDVDRVYNPNTDPGTMFSIGGPVVDPGRSLKLVCDVREMPDWSKIEFFNGSRKLGEVSSPAEPVLQVAVGSKDIVWCLTAMAHSDSGQTRVASPFYFTVRDPQIDLRSNAEKAEKPTYSLPEAIGSRTARAVPEGYQPKADAVEENVLIAYGLTAAQEGSFDVSEGKVSAFWDDIDDDHDAIRMNQYTHAREGSSFSIVTSVDAQMKIKAAHSARGLYLYFEVVDNRFMEVDPDPNRYYNVDAVDVLMDSVSSQTINDPANVTRFINAGWGLYGSVKQYQVAFGKWTPPEFLKRNFADPWDFAYSLPTLADARKHQGIRIRFVKVDPLTRVQEWFLPWSEIGRSGDVASEPAVGTRFAFAPGYNDSDPGEGTTKQLRWIDHTSPWACSATRGEAPRGWGDIEIGPMIGN
jgi:hypothetical protein